MVIVLFVSEHNVNWITETEPHKRGTPNHKHFGSASLPEPLRL